MPIILVQADYDNDGDVDILMLRGGWMRQFGQVPNSLLRNNGDETFTDVTFVAGLGDVHYPTQTGAFADYDNDGDLDLYIGNEARLLQAAVPALPQQRRRHVHGPRPDPRRRSSYHEFPHVVLGL